MTKAIKTVKLNTVQRGTLKEAFFWHMMYRTKLDLKEPDGGVTWQDAIKYRDEKLEKLGLKDLFD